MIKIKASYDTVKEFAALIDILGNAVKSIKVSGEQTGAHKRAYIELIDLEKAEIIRDE